MEPGTKEEGVKSGELARMAYPWYLNREGAAGCSTFTAPLVGGGATERKEGGCLSLKVGGASLQPREIDGKSFKDLQVSDGVFSNVAGLDARW